MATNGILNAALAYHEAGYNLVPLLPREKTAAQPWQRWQRKPQPTSWVERTFANYSGNLATLGGVTSIPNGQRFPYYVDFDEPTTWAELAPECRTRKVRTARGGHAWYVSSKPVRTQKHVGFEVRAAKAYVMAPPSIHPSGLVYQFWDPDEPIMVADSLPFVDLQFDDIPTDYHAALPRLVQRILRNDAATLARYPTRSEIDGALILSLANAGKGLAEIVAILDAATYPSHYRSLPEKQRYRWLFGTYSKCKELGDTPEWQASQAELAQCRAYVVALPHAEITTRRTGVTDKAVLLAHIGAAQAAGSFAYHLSERAGCEVAQCGNVTFTRATGRLVLAGWLAKREPSTVTLARRFELVRTNFRHSHTTTVVCECLNSDTTARSAGCFEYHRKASGGVGRGPGETFVALQRLGVASHDELAQATGFALRTVKRHVLALVSVGLADETGGVVSPTGIDGELVGDLLGTLKIGARRRERHARQRAAWRRHFAKGVQDGDTKTDDTT